MKTFNVDLRPEHHEPSYRRGFQDGYEQAEAAANHAWRGQEKVFHAGGWLDGPTAAEKKAADMAVLAEAHAAGLHETPANRCPVCNGKAPLHPLTCIETTSAVELSQGRRSWICGPGCPESVAVYGPAKP